MKYAIRYQSRGDNTRAVAEIIAGILGVKAEPIDTPLDENVDVLFIRGRWFNTPSNLRFGLAPAQITTIRLTWYIKWVLNQCRYINFLSIDRFFIEKSDTAGLALR
jgi:hypothetical protein